MSDGDKKKTVSISKLEKLSSEELLARIKEKDVKIKEKSDYYNKLHQLNLARLMSYKQYKLEDAKACTDILNKRKTIPVVMEKKVTT